MKCIMKFYLDDAKFIQTINCQFVSLQLLHRAKSRSSFGKRRSPTELAAEVQKIVELRSEG